MKTIDFTQPGGFPLTQDQLGYLQQAYKECANALATMGGSGTTPFIISGLTYSNPTTGEYNIVEGWFFYNDEMTHCPAGSITGASGSLGPYIVIANSSSPLVFNDGSAPNVIKDSSASLQALPLTTPMDATHFPLSALRKFGTLFGAANREPVWRSMAVSTAIADGGVTGTIYYKKDFTANTLQVRGLLSSSNAQNFAASPGSLFYLMGTLPAGYVPTNSTYIVINCFGAVSIKDDLGIGWIKQLNGGINSAGQFYINWIKPDIAVAGYAINFNTIIPLD